MSDDNTPAENWIHLATEALARGDNHQAIHLAQDALANGPPSETAYLILAGAVTDTDEIIHYLNQALEINPQSKRARQGMRWALREQRLRNSVEAASARKAQTSEHGSVAGNNNEGASTHNGAAEEDAIRYRWDAESEIDENDAESDPDHSAKAKEPPALEEKHETTAPRELGDTGPVLTQPLTARLRGWWQKTGRGPSGQSRRSGLTGATLVLLPWLAALLVGVVGLGIWAAGNFKGGFFGSGPILGKPSATPTVSEMSTTATLDLGIVATTQTVKASVTTLPSATLEPSPTATITPTETPSGPTDIPVIEITPLSALPPDNQAPPYQPPVYEPPIAEYSPSIGQHWLDVNLTTQRAYAYDGDTLVREFIVSTGTWQYPTVTGQFYVYIKFVADDMSGPGYYLPNVPYVQYFYKDYALHGTYWHSNFGTPMSHGCINFTTEDAAWVFDWIGVGDLVNIHY